ncbi:MAG TPA: 5'-deoxynucleotidase, partial [Chloroflexota bacterium]|nr:5'-deoxynucleotidase [Chloroflexota bacterium]
MSRSHFYAYLYRLRLIQRWVLMRSTVPENVAEHSFQVALLTHALCTIGHEVFGKEVDAGRAVILALFHDAEEVMTGDIPSPVKHHDPNMLRSVREIESLASEELLRMVPDRLAHAYRPLIGGPERDTELMRWVKAADALDAYLKCATEYAAGNREFAVAERQLEA